MLWEIRASAFIRRDLPLPQTTGDERTFWDSIRVVENAPLYYGESHLMAVDPLVYTPMLEDVFPGVLWSFDAHHDLGYSKDAMKQVIKGDVDCGRWLLWYAIHLQPEIHIIYPRWHTKALEMDTMYDADLLDAMMIEIEREVMPMTGEALPVFDAIFVCRSGAWVPSWCDDAFFAFLDAAPTRNRTKVGTWLYDLKRREFDYDNAVSLATSFEQTAQQASTAPI